MDDKPFQTHTITILIIDIFNCFFCDHVFLDNFAQMESVCTFKVGLRPWMIDQHFVN